MEYSYVWDSLTFHEYVDFFIIIKKGNFWNSPEFFFISLNTPGQTLKDRYIIIIVCEKLHFYDFDVTVWTTEPRAKQNTNMSWPYNFSNNIHNWGERGQIDNIVAQIVFMLEKKGMTWHIVAQMAHANWSWGGCSWRAFREIMRT